VRSKDAAIRSWYGGKEELVKRAATTRRKNLFGFGSKPKHWSQEKGGYQRELKARRAKELRDIKSETAAAKHEKAVAAARAKYEKMMEAKAHKAASSAKKSGAYDYVPSESDIQRAYENGAKTLREALEMAGARVNPAKWERCVRDVQRRGSASNAYAVCAPLRNPPAFKTLTTYTVHVRGKRAAVGLVNGYTKAEALKRARGIYGESVSRVTKRAESRFNPAAEAIEGYKDFHGKDPDEFVTVSRKVHFHQHLSGAGKLKKLVVAPVAGKRKVILSGFGGALLAFNEKRNQLFIEGGDQAVDLGVFGIDTEHELETLGQVVKIEYFTTKDHLGSEGGTATYVHKFRTTNEDGRHVTIRIARYPDLIYRVLDQQLEFSGGSYKILAEGIDE
jgi:hypothetical protein